MVPGVDRTPAATLEKVGLTFTYYVGSGVKGNPLTAAPHDVGTYTVVAAFAGSADYAPAQDGPVTFTIGQALPTLALTAPSKVYDGKAYAATATATGVEKKAVAAATLDGVAVTPIYYTGASVTGTPLGGAPTTAGTYTVVAHFAGSTNYHSLDSSPITFSIGQAKPTVTVTDGGVYNGLPYAAAGKVAGVVTGTGGDSTPAATLENVPLTYTYYAGTSATGTPLGSAPTDVGTYTTVASFAGSTDYLSATSTPATFTITQAKPTVTVTDAGGTYTGSAFPATGTVAGVVAGVDTTPEPTLGGTGLTYTYYSGTSATGTPLGSAPSAIGTYTAVASFAGSTDYLSATSTPVTFAIGKAGRATPTVTVTDAGGGYNGSPYAATAQVNGASSLEAIVPTLSYYSGTGLAITPLLGGPEHPRHLHRDGLLRRQHQLCAGHEYPDRIHDHSGYAHRHRDGPRRNVQRLGVPGHGSGGRRGEGGGHDASA